jgi:hypothetical protein
MVILWRLINGLLQLHLRLKSAMWIMLFHNLRDRFTMGSNMIMPLVWILKRVRHHFARTFMAVPPYSPSFPTQVTANPKRFLHHHQRVQWPSHAIVRAAPLQHNNLYLPPLQGDVATRYNPIMNHPSSDVSAASRWRRK